jgi:photosystem II stability/assembly factor-like uncharacterized protein
MRTVVSFNFNLSGNIAYSDNTTEPFRVSYDSRVSEVLSGTNTVFSNMVGSNYVDIVDFQNNLLPAVWSFAPINTGRAIKDVTIHLYGTVAYDDNTIEMFDIERNRGEVVNHNSNYGLQDISEQINTNVILNNIIQPINEGAVVIDNGIGRNWVKVLEVPRTPGDNIQGYLYFEGGIYFFMIDRFDVDWNTIGSSVYRSTDGVNWTNVLTTTGLHDLVKYLGNGTYVLSDTQNFVVYRSFDYGLTWATIPSIVDVRYFATDLNGVGIISGDNIYRTADFGATWTEIVHGGLGSYHTDVVYSPLRPNEYIYTNSVRMGLSTDKGLTWSTLNSIGGIVPLYQGSTLFMVSGDGTPQNLIKSTDFGRNWTMIFSIPAVATGSIWLSAISNEVTGMVHLAALDPGWLNTEATFYLITNEGDKLTAMNTYANLLQLAANGYIVYFELASQQSIQRSSDFGKTSDSHLDAYNLHLIVGRVLYSDDTASDILYFAT